MEKISRSRRLQALLFYFLPTALAILVYVLPEFYWTQGGVKIDPWRCACIAGGLGLVILFCAYLFSYRREDLPGAVALLANIGGPAMAYVYAYKYLPGAVNTIKSGGDVIVGLVAFWTGYLAIWVYMIALAGDGGGPVRTAMICLFVLTVLTFFWGTGFVTTVMRSGAVFAEFDGNPLRLPDVTGLFIGRLVTSALGVVLATNAKRAKAAKPA